MRTEELIKQDYFIPDLRQKVEKYITNCEPSILRNRKQEKQGGFLHPITKDDQPLYTYHVDHLGPLETTSKRYYHILAVINRFTKFVWSYPTKSTGVQEVLNRLEKQKIIFGNTSRIISDRGSAFTSEEFQKCCRDNGIKHHAETTGLTRANGNVKR